MEDKTSDELISVTLDSSDIEALLAAIVGSWRCHGRVGRQRLDLRRELVAKLILCLSEKN